MVFCQAVLDRSCARLYAFLNADILGWVADQNTSPGVHSDGPGPGGGSGVGGVAAHVERDKLWFCVDLCGFWHQTGQI